MRHVKKDIKHIKISTSILLLSIFVLLQSCSIKEDKYDCGAVFHFRYNQNEVQSMKLLVFTEDGTFLEKYNFSVLDDSTTKYYIPLSRGKYRITAWGNTLSTEDMAGMYLHSEDYKTLEFHSDEIEGGDHLLPIYHGDFGVVEVNGGGLIERNIDLLRNTKRINLEVKDSVYTNISCEVINHNRNYTFDNTPFGELKSIAHAAPESRSSDVANLYYTTHRLGGVAQNNSSIEIYGEKNGVRERLFLGSLVGLLLQNPDITEETLDSRDVFDLVFDFNTTTPTGDKVIKINVEGYLIIYVPSDLG